MLNLQTEKKKDICLFQGRVPPETDSSFGYISQIFSPFKLFWPELIDVSGLSSEMNVIWDCRLGTKWQVALDCREM